MSLVVVEAPVGRLVGQDSEEARTVKGYSVLYLAAGEAVVWWEGEVL